MTESEDVPFQDRLTDPSDIASEQEQVFTDNAIRDTRARSKQDQTADAHGNYEFEDCDECGLEIGLARLRVAPRNLLCVFCATEEEKRLKR